MTAELMMGAADHDLRDGMIALGVGLMLGLAALGGALGQSRAVSSSVESMGRNPSAAKALFTPMVLGLSLIESLVILAWIVAYTMVGNIGQP
jgi:F-type H+-transporting ATPase subunit c